MTGRLKQSDIDALANIDAESIRQFLLASAADQRAIVADLEKLANNPKLAAQWREIARRQAEQYRDAAGQKL